MHIYQMNPILCRNERGVSIVEVMCVLFIMSVVYVFALPSFYTFITRYRLRAAVEELSATLYLARAEAIKHNGFVVLRQKPANDDCSHSILLGSQWQCGWQLFVDQNNNTVFDEGDILLQDAAAKVDIVIGHQPQREFMRFNRWGHGDGLGAYNFVLLSAQDNIKKDYKNAILLCMSAGGRLKKVKGKAPPC